MPLNYDNGNVLPNLTDRDLEATATNPNGGTSQTHTASDMRRGGRPGAPVDVALDTESAPHGMMGRGYGKKVTDPDFANE